MLRSVEQLCHVLDEVVVQAEVLHLLLQVAQFLLRGQQRLHPFLESVVLHDQIADVLLLACQHRLQVRHVLLSTLQFLLEIFLQAHFVVAHQRFYFGSLVLDGRTRLQLQSLDEALLQSQLSRDAPVFPNQVLHLFLQFDVLILDFLVLVVQLFQQFLFLLDFRLLLLFTFDFLFPSFQFFLELSLQLYYAIISCLHSLPQLLLL